MFPCYCTDFFFSVAFDKDWKKEAVSQLEWQGNLFGIQNQRRNYLLMKLNFWKKICQDCSEFWMTLNSIKIEVPGGRGTLW